MDNLNNIVSESNVIGNPFDNTISKIGNKLPSDKTISSEKQITQDQSQKEITPKNLYKKKPGESLKLAVKRMLPGGPLAKKQLTKLKIYSGNEHPHSAQNLTVIELAKLNNKNLLRN